MLSECQTDKAQQYLKLIYSFKKLFVGSILSAPEGGCDTGWDFSGQGGKNLETKLGTLRQSFEQNFCTFVAIVRFYWNFCHQKYNIPPNVSPILIHNNSINYSSLYEGVVDAFNWLGGQVTSSMFW